MGTSVTSTGITFPDSTTQTTAASSAFAAVELAKEVVAPRQEIAELKAKIGG